MEICSPTQNDERLRHLEKNNRSINEGHHKKIGFLIGYNSTHLEICYTYKKSSNAGIKFAEMAHSREPRRALVVRKIGREQNVSG